MLPSSFTPVERTWLWALLAVWALLLFGGFAFGRPDAPRIRRMPAWTRLVSSAILVLAAWSGYAFGRDSAGAPFVLLIAAGMSLGFLGDLYMAQLLPAGQNHVLKGMSSFGLGHVAYSAGLLWFGSHNGLAAPGPRWGAWLAWLLVGAAGWYLVIYRPVRRMLPLHWAALPYTLLLSSTAGCAFGLALQAPSLFPLAAGAILFLLSDTVLAAHLFNNAHFFLVDDVIWLTYGLGQMLIVYAAGSALGLMGR